MQPIKQTTLKTLGLGKGGGSATSTLTVPATPHCTLTAEIMKNLEKVRQSYGSKTKVIENG